MKSLSNKWKIRILFYIGFTIVIYAGAVYGREWYHILLLLLYLSFIMVCLAIYLKEKGTIECPRCTKRVNIEDEICRFCYYPFPPETFSLGKKEGAKRGLVLARIIFSPVTIWK